MTIATAGATRRTQGVSAVSFDVFDTFLLRACTTPDGVFERAYELSGISDMHPNASEHFVQHRIQAEARARKIAKRRSGSAEVRIADIYACFLACISTIRTTSPLPNSAPSWSFAGRIPTCLRNIRR
jgi:hypothetical protein